MPYYANLDEEIDEWQIFQSVQPVFAADLDWDYYPKVLDPAGSPNKAADEGLSFETFKGFFKAEMIALPGLRPTNTLSQPELKLCRKRLTRLLNSLDGFVADGVVKAAAAGESRQKWIPGIPAWNQVKEATNYVLTAARTELQKRLGWPVTAMAQPSPGTSASKGAHDADSTPQNYHRLRALGLLFKQRRNTTQYVTLKQPLSNFVEAKGAVASVRQAFRSSSLPEITLDVTNVADTKWNKIECQKVSLQLYSLVDDGTSGCKGHQAKLQLDGTLLDSPVEPFGLDVFVSPCPKRSSSVTASWCHSHFTWLQSFTGSRPPTSFSAGEELEPIRDLCIYFSLENRQKASYSQTWNISFDDGGLYPSTPFQRPSMADHSATPSPTMPLKTLLARRTLEHGGLFPNTHKAALALSLGRCLLHLLHSGWAQEEWTADAINFLYAKTDGEERIFDIHYPYITCALSGDTISTATEWHRALWSFARLLLEIETGRSTKIGLYDDAITIRDNIWSELRELEIGGRVEEVRRYIQAIHGCVNFAKSVRKHQRETAVTSKKTAKPSKGPDDASYLLCDMRRTLYTEVIQYLEIHYYFLSKNAEAITSCDIPLPAMSIQEQAAEGAELEAANDDNGVSPSLRKCSFYSEPTSAGDLPSIKTNTADFWHRFRQFRRRFMAPKMTKEKIGARPRIRIALLDTGVCETGSDLDSCITEVMKYRETRGFKEKDEKHPIKKRKSFVDGDKSWLDTSSCGHGTQLACLLLRLAPDADLYIAKVSSSMEFAVTEGVVNAIKWAAGKDVQADIITMSFGVDNINDRLNQAINFTIQQVGKSGHTPLMFASASNSGLAKERSYPASDSNVICAYALDGKGNDSSGLNPPTVGDRLNFGTLGHGVGVKWKNKKELASGTSYATPILAAITANYLDWLIHYDAELDPKRAYLRRKVYIEWFLKEHMASKKDDVTKMLFVHPEKCFSFGLYDVAENENLDAKVERADEKTDTHLFGVLNRWLEQISD